MPRPERLENFSIGKIPPSSLLRAVYPFLGQRNPRLIIGPGLGRDVAAIDFGAKVLVFSTDPITGTATRIGRYSIHINANDISTAGARPKWYLCTILLPPNTREEVLRLIMEDMDRAAKGLGIAVIGGHTEVTPRVKQPIIVGFMVGETTKQRLVSPEGGQVGDSILLTKTAGIEGTAILASDYAKRLRRLRSPILAGARMFSDQISVVKEALAAAKVRGVHAMHDPTEGGVLNGLWELSVASNLGIKAVSGQIPIAKETETICKSLGLDPLRLMSSGSLLVAVAPSRVDAATHALEKTGVRVTEIGVLVSRAKGRHMVVGRRTRKLGPVPTDELYRLA
jgi:hydrogenase maturation factor